MSKYAGFSSVKLTKPGRSDFDLSHLKRMSAEAGALTPVFITECVPSDTFRGSTEILLRLAPLLAPIYDQVELYVHFFFVPNRLLWNAGPSDSWETFITGGRLGIGVDPVLAPVPPFADIGAWRDYDEELFAAGSLMDYLGVPPQEILQGPAENWDGKQLHMMPVMAYSLIWFEYYRDRNFETDGYMSFPYAGGLMGPDNFAHLAQIRVRCYEHDYFTSALPFTQRGEEVLMPLAGTGSVTYKSVSDVVVPSAGPTYSGDLVANNVINDLFLADNVTSTNLAARIENIDEVNLDASSVSINDFRSAYALQVWLERNAVGGSRYVESTQAHFGVKPQDARLQRPEYIGGGRIPVKISEVVATAYSANQDDDTVPQGNMAGHGVTYGNTNRFHYFCSEHGFILGIASVMTPPSYHQGLPRMFYARRSFLDYPWPTFAKLGEQQVDNAEIFLTPASITPDAETDQFPLFGYQSRYADWKYICNTNRGDFHSDLRFWTAVRDFSDAPSLGLAFNIYDPTPFNNMFAVPDAGVHKVWMYVHNHVTVRRPLPYFGTPNTLGFS